VPKLALVGRPGWLINDLLAQLHADPVTKGHLVLSRDACDEELIWLYRHCLFTVYPSFYEGWGLPVAESLSFGKYCLASQAASMPEIGGELCDYHDPLDLEGFLRLVERPLFDPAFLSQREQRVRERYRPTTWRDCAARVLELLGKHFLAPAAPREEEAPRPLRLAA
jgi:glycosyltransferase involved in cell wall biosynthesis